MRLQQVTSLRRRAQANAPAASCRRRRDYRSRGVRGGALCHYGLLSVGSAELRPILVFGLGYISVGTASP